MLTQTVVAAAFGPATPVVGYDSRPIDGRILVLRRPDGKSLGIGDSRPGSAVPPQFTDVETELSRLDVQMASESGVREPRALR